MNTHNDNATENQLPVLDILKASIKQPFEHASTIVRLAWPYILMSVLITILSATIGEGLYNLLVLPFIIITSVLAGVACHKVFLCSPEEVSQLSTFRWSSYDSNFLISGLKLVFALLLGVVLALGLGAIIENVTKTEIITSGTYSGRTALEWLAMVVFAYLFSRISMILPGAAVGRYFNFNTSWAATKPYAFRLFLLISFIPIVAANFINEIFSALIELGVDHILIQIFMSLISLLGAVIELCILSKSFEWVTKQGIESDKAAS